MQHCIELIRYFNETKCYILDHKFALHNQDLINDLKIVINNVLGKVSWSLQRKSPSMLFNLFCMFFRCKLKANLVSNTILRYLWVDDELTNFGQNIKEGWSILLILQLKITSWACFLNLKSNYFAENHWVYNDAI